LPSSRRRESSARAGLRQARAKQARCSRRAFVEAVAEALVRLGHDSLAIKTERFGPTGR
jgi:ferredoxin-NADP reductase